jgi:hypothetical protein
VILFKKPPLNVIYIQAQNINIVLIKYPSWKGGRTQTLTASYDLTVYNENHTPRATVMRRVARVETLP